MMFYSQLIGEKGGHVKRKSSEEKNLARCCTYEPCPRKGNGCECLNYHAGMRQLPAFVFPPDAATTYGAFEHFARRVAERRT